MEVKFITDNNGIHYLAIKSNVNYIDEPILGKCNNIDSMPYEMMYITDILSISKSVYCDGIWPEGSVLRILASNSSELYTPRIPEHILSKCSNGDMVDIEGLMFKKSVGPNRYDAETFYPEVNSRGYIIGSKID